MLFPFKTLKFCGKVVFSIPICRNKRCANLLKSVKLPKSKCPDWYQKNCSDLQGLSWIQNASRIAGMLFWAPNTVFRIQNYVNLKGLAHFRWEDLMGLFFNVQLMPISYIFLPQANFRKCNTILSTVCNTVPSLLWQQVELSNRLNVFIKIMNKTRLLIHFPLLTLIFLLFAFRDLKR